MKKIGFHLAHPEDNIMKIILLALKYSSTQSIKRIKQLELDSNTIAIKLMTNYWDVKSF